MKKPLAFTSVLLLVILGFFLHAPLSSCTKTKTVTDTITKTVNDTITKTVVDTFRLPVKLDSGLVAYYPFNGNISDSTGNGNTGQIVGTVQYSTDAGNHPGGAASFNGSSYILVSDKGDLSSPAFSISVEFYENNTTHQNLLSKVNYSNGTSPIYGISPFGGTGANPLSLGFGVLGPGVACGVAEPFTAQELVYTNDTIETGKWYQLVCTYDTGVEKIYLNGVLKSSMNVAFQQAKQCTDAQMVIGAFCASNPFYYNGKLDELRLYKRALNYREIKTLATGF
jgi:hypothetical protein